MPLHDRSGEVAGVLDIDSRELNTFDDEDARWLQEIARVITRHAVGLGATPACPPAQPQSNA